MRNHSLRKAVGKVDTLKKNKEKLIPGLLGIDRGTKVVSVPTRPGYVYVRLRSNTSELIQAFNAKVALVYDLPVLVYRDEIDPNRYRIHSRDIGQYSSNWGNRSAYLPPHGGTHSLSPSGGGADPVWVYGRQFMPLHVRPSGTVGARNVVIDPFVYYSGDYEEYKYAGDVGTGDIVTFKPSNNQQRMVLIYLDTNGDPQLMPGDLFAAGTTGTSSVLQYIPTINRDVGMPLAAARLVSGTTTIQWSNLYDLRPIISWDDTDQIGVYDDGAFVVSGTAFDFGSNLDVVASGTTVFISATGGGGGGGDLTFYEDSVFVATGTSVSFEDTFSVVATGTTIFVSSTATPGGAGGTPTTYYDDGTLVATGTKVSFESNLSVVATGTSIFVTATDTNTDTPTYPAVSDDSVFQATGTHLDFGANLSVSVTGTTVFIDATDTNTDTPTYPAIYDDDVFVSTGTAIDFGQNIDVAVTGTVVYVSSVDTNTDTPTYPAVYDDDVFVATGTALDFGENINVAVTGTVLYISAVDTTIPNTDTPTYPYVSDDGGGIATGTQFEFGANLAVVATGTVIYVDATDTNTDTPTYPAIYAVDAFIVTGTKIDFDINFTVTSTGTVSYISLKNPNTDTPTYPAIHDDGVFLVTGTAISVEGGLTVVATGTVVYIEMGTPTAVSSTSSNTVDTDSHTHIVTASSNPGIAASLLETDASGNLQVNVMKAGDFVSAGTIAATGTVSSGADVQLDNHLLLKELPGSQSAPSSDYGQVYVSTSGTAYFQNDDAEVFPLAPDYDTLYYHANGEVPTGTLAYFHIPSDREIKEVVLLSSSTTGTAVVDFWVDSYTNFPPTIADTITASSIPTIATGTKYQDSVLTGWSTGLYKDDVILFYVKETNGMDALSISLHTIEKILPVFSPLDISGTIRWWDFTDITQLYQDTFAVTPVTADADPIGRVNDKSDTADYLFQATTANKPQYKENIINGNSVGRFDNSNDQLAYSSGISADVNIFVVVKFSNSDLYEPVFAWDQSTTVFTGFNGTRYEVNKLAYGGTYDTSSFHFYEINQFIMTGTADALSQDGTNIVSSFRTNGLDSGGNDRVGSAGSYFLGGDIAEIIVYNHNLSSEDRASLEAYFTDKYGI